MSDTDRLRDLLAQAAPEHPDVDPTSRAAAVARRGRNARVRDRALVAVAAVAVVAAVAGPVAFGDDSEELSYPTVEPTVVVAPCPATPVDWTTHLRAPSIGEAVAVRSCPAVDPLPDGPLVGAAAQAFADDVAALSPFTMPSYCTVITMPHQPWALQVQTPDGGLITLASPTRECDQVTVGGVDHGSDELLAAYVGNLARQRSGIPPFQCPTGDRLGDGAPTWNASFDPATAVAGVACRRGDPMGAPEHLQDGAVLSEDQLATIRDDLAAHRTSTSGDGMCIDTGPQRMVLLEDADGDQAAWVDDRCTGQFAGPGGYWTPGPAAQQAFDDALNR